MNLHVVLCLSPVGDTFRERCRMFPGLVNCTTIDWFTEWPSDALYEVATRQMAGENLGSDEVKQAVCKVCCRLLGCLGLCDVSWSVVC
jgi:dynein heavy chain